MRLPFKVSTTTSNFMIGVTAAASAGVYLSRGYNRSGPRHAGDARRVDRLAPRRACAGGRAEHGAQADLRRAVILLLGVEMIYNGLTGRDVGMASKQRDGRTSEWSRRIGRLLRNGLIIAAAVVAVGAVVY
jgi:hypothetical protein